MQKKSKELAEKPLMPVLESCVPKAALEPQSFEEMVYQCLGEASVCWSELPKGTFNSSEALKIAQKIINWHDKELSEAHNI